MISKILIPALFLLSQNAIADVEKREFPAEKIKELIVENNEGGVDISAIEGEKFQLEFDKRIFGSGCLLDVSKGEKTLKIRSEVKGAFNTNNCVVDMRLRVPKKIYLKLRSGRGETKVVGTRGAVDISAGLGGVVVDAEVQSAEVRAGKGGVTFRGLMGDGNFDIGAGSLRVEYAAAPKEGELEINAGSGDVELLFPAGVKMQSKIRAGSGEVFKEIEDSADAVFRLKINAGSGDVRVKKIAQKD